MLDNAGYARVCCPGVMCDFQLRPEKLCSVAVVAAAACLWTFFLELFQSVPYSEILKMVRAEVSTCLRVFWLATTNTPCQSIEDSKRHNSVNTTCSFVAVVVQLNNTWH